jgi:hypothetical protein
MVSVTAHLDQLLARQARWDAMTESERRAETDELLASGGTIGFEG